MNDLPQPRRRQHGVGMISVLMAMLIFSLGLIGIAAVYSRLTSVMTQDQNLLRASQAANTYWAVIQANPALVTTSGTFTASNINSAPAALRDWLTQATASGTGIPDLSVVLTTGADAVSGAACSATGCSVSLQMSWSQPGDNQSTAVTRSQTFNFQFGL